MYCRIWIEILIQKGYLPIFLLLSARNTLQSLIYIPGTTSHKLWLLSQPTFKLLVEATKSQKVYIFNFNYKNRSTNVASINFFSNFSCMFLNPNFFSYLNSNCSNSSSLRNLQEQVKKAFCYQKLF